MSLAPWLLAPALAVAGARLALGAVRDADSLRPWKRATTACALGLFCASIAVGARRIAELPRAEALPPSNDPFGGGGPRPGASPAAVAPSDGSGAKLAEAAASPRPAAKNDAPHDGDDRNRPGDGEQGDAIPPPRDSPYAVYLTVPLGGGHPLQSIGPRWYELSALHVAVLDAGDLCAKFRRVPSLCIHDKGAPAQLVSTLRSDAKSLGIAEIADCPELSGVAQVVSDLGDEIADVALAPGKTAEVKILERTVSLSAAAAPGRPTSVTFAPRDGGRTTVEVAGDDAPPFELSLGRAKVRLRVGQRREGDVLHLRLHDLHLVCS